jgi:NADH:ubiquinone oxidoreductase subunit F (NADH-binding)/(2Fe-2S) ferredoxin
MSEGTIPGGVQNGDRDPVEVRVCTGSCCVALGALEVVEAVREGVAGEGTEAEISSRPGIVGCRGFCSQGPLVYLPQSDVLYCRVQPDDVGEILEKALEKTGVVERLLCVDPATGRRFRGLADNPFFAKQERQVLARCGVVDPESVGHAVALGAYSALRRSVEELDPKRIIDLVKRSGLQERGGAGFPVGLKWAVVAEAPAELRYVIGNGDGGDPGATVDRTLLEGDPHGVIEGMAIAAFAVGAREGRLFLRSEHATGVARAERAVAQARRQGYLGRAIFGAAFDFDIEICENAGASIGGEETSLLNVIQGGRGVARPRPPFPAVSGLWGRPTLINSLETLANIPLVVQPERLGSDASPARTKVVCVSGAVCRPGIAEVPLGTPIGDVIDGIAGGGVDGDVLAAHLGGPGGVTLGPDQFGTKIDFGSLRSHGADLGSGSLVVLGAGGCPVALARFLAAFCVEESCGTCPPCRIGSRAILNILDRVGSGEAEAAQLDQLERLCRHVRRTSMCELGRRTSSSVLTGLRNFRASFESHLSGRGCPTGSCRPADDRRLSH